MRYRYCVFLLIATTSFSCQQSDSAPTSPSPATQKSTPAVITATSATTTSQPSPYFRAPELAAMRTLPRENDPLPMTEEEIWNISKPASNYYESENVINQNLSELDDSEYIRATMAIRTFGREFSRCDQESQFVRPPDASQLSRAHALLFLRGYGRFDHYVKTLSDSKAAIFAEISSGKWLEDSKDCPVEVAFWMAKSIFSPSRSDETPKRCWENLRAGVMKLQNSDGGWGRDGDVSDMAMTAAALWTLQQCRLKLDRDLFDSKLTDADYLAMEKGFAWMNANFTKFIAGEFREKDSVPKILFHISEMAIISGLDRIGDVKWFDAGVKILADTRNAQGVWIKDRDWLPTVYAAIFLTRIHYGILGQLKYNGDWNERPLAVRSAADGLGRYINCGEEGYNTWRIVDLDWPLDSWPPVKALMICGNNAGTFTDSQVQKLKTYIERGNLLIFPCRNNGDEKLMARIMPEYKFFEIPPSHPAWTNGRIRVNSPPKVLLISNSVRPLAAMFNDDICLPFQKYDYSQNQSNSTALLAIANYHAIQFGNCPIWPVEQKFTPVATIKAARLKYDGFIDREPQAWERFRLTLARHHKIQADIVGPVEIADLTASGAKIAILEGVGNISLTDDQRSALKKFVANGGTLLVDSLGGDETFANDAKAELQKIWGGDAMRQIAPDSPVLNIQDCKIEKVRYQRAARQRLDSDSRRRPPLQTIDIGGRSAVFFSREDIAAALLGCQAATIDGYAPESAYELARNIFIYAGQTKLPTPATKPAD